MAHRGCRASAPENSMRAFQLALDQGADVLETDLRITADGVIVCFHDAAVRRMSSGRGRVDGYSWSRLRELRLKSPDGALDDEATIPALQEVLERFGPYWFFALELKAPSFTRAEEIEFLTDMLEEHDATDRVVVMSFSRRILRLAEELSVPFPLVHIALFSPWPSARYPLVGAWWPMFFINPWYVAICHRRGQICCPLDPRPEARLRQYLHMGVDVLLTDNPQLTRQKLGELSETV